MHVSWVVLACFSMWLVGCGDGPKAGVSGSSTAPSAAPCARFGDRCEVSPGKLGACVEKTGCNGPGCFVCQSQH